MYVVYWMLSLNEKKSWRMAITMPLYGVLMLALVLANASKL